MADLNHAIQQIWSSDYVQKNPNKAYKTSYPTEYAAVATYVNGGARPSNTSAYSKLGLGLVEAEDVLRNVTPPPLPPNVSRSTPTAKVA
jgi:hypothetical protein